ncbi:MAG TPA: hypothetical protein VM118_01980 [Acidobacteriota bacterium]|nr:hypothetical protein [Acidobacteriota bacterium]
MRLWFTTGCLTAVGVLLLVGASGTETTDPADALRQLGVPDSIADQWVEPYIPLWALTQEAPVVGPEGPVGALTSLVTTDCPPSLEISLIVPSLAVHFDHERAVTELYNRDHILGQITRYDVSSDLSYTAVGIPINPGTPELAADLDQDGRVEIVSQYWEHILIHSSPDGTLLADFYWPGLNVEMHPVAVNIDDDPYLEVYVTPHSLGFYARVVLIDYNPVTDSFEKIADMEAPYGAAGYPAVGDFDADGRVEFISGTYQYGYRLYEWREGTLAYVGLVGDSLGIMNYAAVACRPKPGGVLHALLGHSGADVGFHYQLLEPTGDNTFDVVKLFQEHTGFTGTHPCWATDTDCDGLDELATTFYPDFRVWEWDEGLGDFDEGCVWDEGTYGTLSTWRDVDLDQNGTREWATLNDVTMLRVFPDPDCVGCDTAGICPWGRPCGCACLGDPVCDSVTDVLDVVTAVDVAFRSAPSASDPFLTCPMSRTDVDCDSVTNVIDVVHFINVAFRNGDPATEFCDPCP